MSYTLRTFRRTEARTDRQKGGRTDPSERKASLSIKIRVVFLRFQYYLLIKGMHRGRFIIHGMMLK